MSQLRVDPLLSYARRSGDDVQVTLEISGPRPSGDLGLRLRGTDTVDHPVSVTPSGKGRFRVEALIPKAGLDDGTWRMRLLDGSGEQRNLQTRLLLREGMPIALLPGRPPDTVLPEPSPRG
jgi:hypothetical protein